MVAATGRMFVGRQAELALLAGAWADASSGHGEAWLISGEPGIGKTSLVEQVAEKAMAEGARCLWGRGWEGGGAPAFWPWTEALRSWRDGGGLDAARAQLGEAGALVGPLFGEAVPDAGGRVADVEAARFAMFDAAGRLLDAVAGERPLLMVMDDLHAADMASVSLAEFVARLAGRRRWLLVGTHRLAEVAADSARGAVLDRIARYGGAVQLSGLDADEVARLLGTGGPKLDPAKVRAATAGNPFFVRQVVAAGGIALSHGVRAAVRARLAGLSAGTRTVLGFAAVAGREFDLAVLAQLVADCEPALVEAQTHGLVEPLTGRSGGWQFTHGLIRDTLYDDLGPEVRDDAHARIAQALEVVHADDLDRHAGLLAHHHLATLPRGDAAKAASFTLRAAQDAIQRLAHEEVVGHLMRARQAADLPGVDDRLRCDVLLQSAYVASAQSFAEQRALLELAIAVARRLGDGERLAHAAVIHAGWGSHGFDASSLALLEEALVLLGDQPSPWRPRLLAGLAIQLAWAGDFDRASAMVAEARILVAELDDADAAAAAAWARVSVAAIYGPEAAEELLAACEDFVRVARPSLRSPNRQYSAVTWLMVEPLLWLGRGAEARAAIAGMGDLEPGPQDNPLQDLTLAHLRAIRGLLDGDLEGVAAAVQRMEGVQAVVRNPAVEANLATLRFLLHWNQGRSDVLDEDVQRLAGQIESPAIAGYVLPLVRLEQGRPDAAARELGRYSHEELRGLRRDSMRSLALCVLADAAASLADAGRAAALAEALEPMAGLVLGYVMFACAPADRLLGRLRGVLGDREGGQQHFEAALDVCERLDAPLLRARTVADYASFLLASPDQAEQARGRELAEQALADAQRLGMARLAEQMQALLDDAGGPAAAVAPTVVSSPGVFRREGGYWTLSWGGETVRLKDSKGMGYLARLVANPGVEIHAVELLGEGDATVAAAAGGDAGPLLDAAAKAAYKRRVTELREDVEEAEANFDSGRAARARDELEFLTDELARGVGLGGRDRVAGSMSERARVNVTRTLKSALRAIGQHAPVLGQHFAQAVHTGTYCSYTPDPTTAIRWER